MKALCLVIAMVLLVQAGFAQQLIPYRSGDLWGYATPEGAVKISPEYEEAGEFWSEVTWVKKKGKFGYIDRNGHAVTRFQFDKVSAHGPQGVAYVTKKGEQYCIDLNGNRTQCSSACGGPVMLISYFHKYWDGDKLGIFVANPENIATGEPLVKLPAIWSEFRENYAGYAAVRKDSLWGIIDRRGELVIPYQYQEININTYGASKNHFFRVKKDGKFGFLDKEGKLVIEPIYEKVDFFSGNGIAKVWVDDAFWGYVDEMGKEYFQRP